MTLKTFRTQQEWHTLIASWKASGKKAKSWCEEHSIHPNSFHTAYRRLFPPQNPLIARTCFTELKQATEPVPDIELTFKGAQLKLSSHFDEVTVLRLLKVLEQLSC